jgi:hypothetical protein
VVVSLVHILKELTGGKPKMLAYEISEWNALTEEQRSAILKKAYETQEVISIAGKIYSSAPTFDEVLALHPRLGIDEQDR